MQFKKLSWTFGILWQWCWWTCDIHSLGQHKERMTFLSQKPWRSQFGRFKNWIVGWPLYLTIALLTLSSHLWKTLSSWHWHFDSNWLYVVSWLAKNHQIFKLYHSWRIVCCVLLHQLIHLCLYGRSPAHPLMLMPLLLLALMSCHILSAARLQSHLCFLFQIPSFQTIHSGSFQMNLSHDGNHPIQLKQWPSSHAQHQVADSGQLMSMWSKLLLPSMYPHSVGKTECECLIWGYARKRTRTCVN